MAVLEQIVAVSLRTWCRGFITRENLVVYEVFSDLNQIIATEMTTAQELAVDIPARLRDNSTVGAGLSSWVVELDAVAKCFFSEDARLTEIAVYDRLINLGSSQKRIMRFYGLLEKAVVLQHARNGTVRQYLARSSRQQNSQTILRWAEQAAEAVQVLHARQIFHCDISCNNFFLDENLNVVIGDFGGASIDGSEGQSWYELRSSLPLEATASVKTEIFALGSAFYEISTKEVPFRDLGDHVVEALYANGQFPDVRTLMLGTIISKCWERAYHSVDEVLVDIYNRE